MMLPDGMPYKRSSFLMGLVALHLTASLAQIEDQISQGNQPGLEIVAGDAADGIQPTVLVGKESGKWLVDFEYTAKTNFAMNSWLQITNRVGSKVRLWLTNGTEVMSTNRDVLDAKTLPLATTVSNFFLGVDHWRHARQWLALRPDADGGMVGKTVPATASHFSVNDVFDCSSTNWLILQVTPLLYRVDERMEKARLVTFPPVRLMLLPDGGVEKLDGAGNSWRPK